MTHSIPTHYVECVAPLLRGLKLSANGIAAGDAVETRRMRCPAIEGIETPPCAGPSRAAVAGGRMRCPAIEGIETQQHLRRPRHFVRERVECVAPLLRGLKHVNPISIRAQKKSRGSNALPRY